VEDKKIKVYIAILNRGWIRREILEAFASKNWDIKGVERIMEKPSKTWANPISSNRNLITKRFLATDCNFLLMLDDDVVPLSNPFKLVFADKDIIGMPARVRTQVGYVNWVAYIENPDKETYVSVDFSKVDDTIDLLSVDAIGTGCILIKRKVLENMKAPFHTPFDEDGITIYGTDIAFCRKAKEAGFEIYTTPSRLCDHYKEVGLLQINQTNDWDHADPAAIDYGLPWGGMSINPIEWDFIKKIILEKKIKNVLEFGSGLSTLMMSSMVSVLSLETDEEWMKEIEKRRTPINNFEIRKWDGVSFPDGEYREKYDLAFVDGPAGGENREFSYIKASEHCNKIICHDGQRLPDLYWQKKYLQGKYKLKDRSGYYQACCHYWEKIDA
jgi:hypothetical protein